MSARNEGMDMSRYPSAAELRRWAESKQPGAVRRNGRLPKFLVVAWNRTHPDRTYDEAQAYHGTVHGYENRDCRCIGCCEAGQSYARLMKADIAAAEAEELADAFLGEPGA